VALPTPTAEGHVEQQWLQTVTGISEPAFRGGPLLVFVPKRTKLLSLPRGEKAEDAIGGHGFLSFGFGPQCVVVDEGVAGIDPNKIRITRSTSIGSSAIGAIVIATMARCQECSAEFS